ncbi:MAG: type II toxin-antitoxin system HicA family toxin [Thermodesulfobacteriota bacterium]
MEHVLVQNGFKFERQQGDHRAYVKEGVLRPVIIPMYDDLPAFIVKRCLNTAGITRRECLRLLGREN